MKKFWSFILVAFGLGWLLQGVGMLLGGVWYTVSLSACMFAPLFGVLISHGGLKTSVSGVKWKLRLKGRLRWWFAALWGPAAVTVAGGALFFLVLPGRFDTSLSYLSSEASASGLNLAGISLSPWTIAAVELLEAVTVAPFLNMFFAVGEETGWRGYMTPFLCEKLGHRWGLVVSGAVWGAWHWPLICLAGYNFGTGYFGAPVTGAAMMCVACAALGILLAFVYDKTQSIWAPALCHGAVNAVAGLGNLFLAPSVTSYILGPFPFGLIGGIPLFALGAWALAGKRKAK